jgi:hypothetical protein
MATGPWHFVMFGHWRGGLQLHSVRDARMGSLPGVSSPPAPPMLGNASRSGPIVSRRVQPPPQQTAKVCDGSWPKNLWCTLHFALLTLHFQLSKLFCFGTEKVSHPMDVGSSYRLCGYPKRSVSKYLLLTRAHYSAR